MPDVTSYKYLDGSGNTYVITVDTLQYIPVTPMNSSSLYYHGGDPANVPITAEQFHTISGLFESHILNTALHIEQRVMMSGVIIRNNGPEKKEVILRPGSREIFAIETELNKLVKKK